MKAEMGQKLSRELLGLPACPCGRNEGVRRTGLPARKKRPRRRRRGLSFASTAEKRCDQLIVQLRAIVPGVPPADKIREAPDPV